MRDKIKLVSSAGTGHFYTTTKNKRLHPEKVEIKKGTSMNVRSVCGVQPLCPGRLRHADSPMMWQS